MWQEGQTKTTPEHLRKGAYLYVRQSTLRQVVENCESTQRQYALRQRAVALGWSEEQVVVIDSDLGQSGVRRRIGRDFSVWWRKWEWVAPAW